jgi:hypothetical protein
MSTILIARPSRRCHRGRPFTLTRRHHCGGDHCGDHYHYYVGPYVALSGGPRNPLMPTLDGKSMSVPQYCNTVPDDSRAGGGPSETFAFTACLKVLATLRQPKTADRLAGTIRT